MQKIKNLAINEEFWETLPNILKFYSRIVIQILESETLKSLTNISNCSVGLTGVNTQLAYHSDKALISNYTSIWAAIAKDIQFLEFRYVRVEEH